MRYLNIDDEVFTDSNGNSYTVKSLRELEDNRIIFTLKLSVNEYLDEIASRPEIYGEDAEDICYKIFDANSIKIYENDFDLSKIRELKIPER